MSRPLRFRSGPSTAKLRRVALLLVVAPALCAPCAASAADGATKTNVLFLMADDLRADLGCYGSHAKSPHVDRLAKRGVLFERAYCQQALCNPSRSSMLSGRRPDTLGLWANGTHFRAKNPDLVTLPQRFLEHGWTTRNVGKIFHNWHTTPKGDRPSWSAPEFLHYANHGDDLPVVKDGKPPKSTVSAPRCQRCDVPDDAYFDGRVAEEAVRVLREVRDRPFFLAVGFWKPHAPFNAPAAYWDRYVRDMLPKLDPRRPSGAPDLAFHDAREIFGFGEMRREYTLPESAEARHGYVAGVSYMDAQVGKVLAALDELDLAGRTVVVFCSDHGYHLGEHGLWAKTSCFELDARVPLVIAPPQCARAGSRSASLVELVDLYPTLIELCGLPPTADLDGRSLVPLLNDPQGSVKDAAFTQHPRPAYYDRTEKGIPDAMGYSVRTRRVRYTEWRDWATGRVAARELYEHDRDPHETRNAIDAPADRAALDEAVRLLHAQFPPGKAWERRGR